ncbi:MAG: hypothetical protein V9G19_10190 [Tetrasphaera sp.]
MKRTLAAAAAVLAAATAASAASATAPAAGAASPSLTMTYLPIQVVGQPDPSEVSADFRITGVDCSVKCELWKYVYNHGDGDAWVLATWTGPASGAKVVRDQVWVDEIGDQGYYVERYRADGTSDQPLSASGGAFSLPDSLATVGPGFRRELDLQATETMVLRSSTPGATATFPASPYGDRLVGVVAERGPAAGVLRVVVGGSTALTVDLKRPTTTKRAIVGTIRVPQGAAIRMQNATPAGRSAKQVAVDGLITLGVRSDARAGARPPQERPARSGDETISYTVPDRQLPAGDAGLGIDIEVKVHGCPTGCQVVGPGGDGAVIWSKRSPRSGPLQTFHIPAVAPFSGGDWVFYYLKIGGDRVDVIDVSPNKLEQDYVDTTYDPRDRLVYSAGWTQDSMASATGGFLKRSSTPNTGMTYRTEGDYVEHRVAVVAARGAHNGVMKIYSGLDLVKTIDLYAARWQARQVVAAIDLPEKGRFTVVNATPAGRPNKDVHVDAIIVLGTNDIWRAGR